MTKMIVFPGQGSQFVGMGKDLYDHSEEARKIFQEADDALGYSISDICFNGPAEELVLTKNTQPALLTVSYALWKEYEKKAGSDGIAFMAGHSLGEYTALAASGVMSFRDAVIAVHKRGLFMQEAVPVGDGAMAAVIGVPREELMKLCEESGEVVVPANYNSSQQIVISGSTAGVDYVVGKLKEQRKKAIKLKVSAPFHSPLMLPAASQMRRVLDYMIFHPFNILVISNVTGKPVEDPEKMKDLLEAQISGAVLWEESVQFAKAHGVTRVVEIGPGNVLAKLSLQIEPDLEVQNIGSWDDIEKMG